MTECPFLLWLTQINASIFKFFHFQINVPKTYSVKNVAYKTTKITCTQARYLPGRQWGFPSLCCIDVALSWIFIKSGQITSHANLNVSNSSMDLFHNCKSTSRQTMNVPCTARAVQCQFWCKYTYETTPCVAASNANFWGLTRYHMDAKDALKNDVVVKGVYWVSNTYCSNCTPSFLEAKHLMGNG